jgi:RHS repeat-associated protein
MLACLPKTAHREILRRRYRHVGRLHGVNAGRIRANRPCLRNGVLDRQDYNYFRDYEPGTGRYVESDPIFQPRNFGLPLYQVAPFAPKLGLDINLYGYVSQSPLIFIDETGQGLLGYFECLWYSSKMSAKNKECTADCNKYDDNGTDLDKTIEWMDNYSQYAGPLSGTSASSAAVGCACYKAGGPEFCKKWIKACLTAGGTRPKATP